MSFPKIFGLVLIFLGLGSLIAIVVTYLLSGSKAKAGLRIETEPPSLVYIDDIQMGTTPLEKTFPAKEVFVRLVPESTNAAISAYQTRIRLVDGITSILRRKFVSPDSQSSGETISFTPDTSGGAPISIITTDPEYATVFVDGRAQSQSPLTITDVLSGEHQIALTAPGYEPKTISIKNPPGFRTQISAKLSKLAMAPEPSPTPPATVSAVPMVRILDTPTGFLRVRSAPSSAAAEIGRVNPGESFELLDQTTGWYRIRVNFESTSSGWLSSQYSSLN